MLWHLYCHVIDNYGDLGVSWRLAAQLGALGHAVDLYVDDPSALAWMAPAGAAGVRVHAGLSPAAPYAAPDVLVAAFGGALAPQVLEALQAATRAGRTVPWIQLEYLSAEAYVEPSHGLASPVHGGAAAGIAKWFFFPGFTERTGGLLREPDLLARRAAFDRAGWLRGQGIAPPGALPLASLFCYEPPALAEWLLSLDRSPMRVLVTPGRAAQAVHAAIALLPAAWHRRHGGNLHFLPGLAQTDYDHLLWSCDLNFVRGEDSLVRALWAGAASVWQAYPQDGAAQADKLQAYLAWLQAPPDLVQFHRAWNLGELALPEAPRLPAWTGVIRAARERLAAQDDLVTRLVRFAAEKR